MGFLAHALLVVVGAHVRERRHKNQFGVTYTHTRTHQEPGVRV